MFFLLPSTATRTNHNLIKSYIYTHTVYVCIFVCAHVIVTHFSQVENWRSEPGNCFFKVEFNWKIFRSFNWIVLGKNIFGFRLCDEWINFSILHMIEMKNYVNCEGLLPLSLCQWNRIKAKKNMKAQKGNLNLIKNSYLSHQRNNAERCRKFMISLKWAVLHPQQNDDDPTTEHLPCAAREWLKRGSSDGILLQAHRKKW